MRCPDCDFENPGGMRFCGNCGTRLLEEPDAVSAARPAAEEAVWQSTAGEALELTEAAVVFVDLSGYTRIAEQLDGEDLYELVQRFLALMTDCVNSSGGVVEQYTGDGLIATFAAAPGKNHTAMALRAALHMQKAVRELEQEAAHTEGVALDIHIGLHSGPVFSGVNLEPAVWERDPTTLGQTVYLARRLEEAAPPGEILVSERVKQQAQDWFNFEIWHLGIESLPEDLHTCYRFTGEKHAAGQHQTES